MVTLDKDHYIHLFMTSDIDIIKKMSLLNHEINELYSDENLWKQKFLKDFEPRLIEPKSWKMAYALQINNVIKFKTTFKPFNSHNDGDDLSLHTLDCEIHLQQTEIFTDADINEFGNDGLTLHGNLKFKFKTNMVLPRELFDDDLRISIIDQLSKYFKFATDDGFDDQIYKDKITDKFYNLSLNSDLVFEILGICRIY